MRKVLLVTFDQWRGGAMSALGHQQALTPHIDALAARSTQFTRHYASAAPCGPSRASLLTGLYPFNHRSIRNGTPLDARHQTLPVAARGAGLTPYLYGYTDTALDPRGRPAGDPAIRTYEGVMDGFELGCRMSGETPPMNDWAAHLARKGYDVPLRHGELLYGLGALEPGEPATRRPAFYRAEDSDTAYLADRVIDFLTVSAGAEWLIHASFLRPHPPLIAPAPYNDIVDPADVDPPVRAATLEEETAAHPFLDLWLNHQQALPTFFQANFQPNRLSLDEIRLMRAVYYGLIQECDHHFGRVMAALEASGQAEETLVIVTSDHGEMLGDHWMWGKGGFFDQANHIPLIIRDPSGGGGRRVDAFTESVDVAPTIIEWLGEDPPIAWDGRSLAPWLRGETPAWRDAAFWEYDFRGALAEERFGLTTSQCVINVLRDAQGKYVHCNGLPALRYDLRADPHERAPLAPETDPAISLDYASRLLSRRMTHAERVLADTLLTPDGPLSARGPRY